MKIHANLIESTGAADFLSRYNACGDSNLKWHKLQDNATSVTESISQKDKFVVFLRVQDRASNETIVNSNGVIIYENSAIIDNFMRYFGDESSDADLKVRINLGKNTISSIVDEADKLNLGTDYLLQPPAHDDENCSAECKYIVLLPSYLHKLQTGLHEFTIAIDVEGVKYSEDSSGTKPLSATFTVQKTPPLFRFKLNWISTTTHMARSGYTENTRIYAN
ncbi:MAG: hypothetical protein LBP35_06255 [Candidatus Ancillula trichonymphae]|jgi:hypothetical protein|nr:hypothetical protein [Candidatus Ancillula trichonymphae]